VNQSTHYAHQSRLDFNVVISTCEGSILDESHLIMYSSIGILMRLGDGGGGNSLVGAESLPVVRPTPMYESGLTSVCVVVCSRLVVVPTLAVTMTSRSGGLVGAPTLAAAPTARSERLGEAPTLA